MNDAKSKRALGFLTVVEDPRDGFFGGYLVLNMAGRPLEFHCTAPIKPNRAQQILYGPTLEPYLLGEQIGQTLLGRARNHPCVVCTDREPILAARDSVNVPLVLVLPAEDGHGAGKPDTPPMGTSEPQAEIPVWRLDAPHSNSRSGLIAFRHGRNRLAVPESSPHNPRSVAECLSDLSDWFDLAEPFQRIREASEEARRGRH